MSKILYPVGTRVVVKSDSQGVYYVVRYNKGKKFPYQVSYSPDDSPVTINGKTKFSVKGLKRYTPTSPKKSTVSKASVEQVPKQAVCQCDMSNYFTKEEVLLLVETALDDVYRNLDLNYGELKGDITRLAGAADRNFGKIQGKFKTLNHDDD